MESDLEAAVKRKMDTFSTSLPTDTRGMGKKAATLKRAVRKATCSRKTRLGNWEVCCNL